MGVCVCVHVCMTVQLVMIYAHAINSLLIRIALFLFETYRISYIYSLLVYTVFILHDSYI